MIFGFFKIHFLKYDYKFSSSMLFLSNNCQIKAVIHYKHPNATVSTANYFLLCSRMHWRIKHWPCFSSRTWQNEARGFATAGVLLWSWRCRQKRITIHTVRWINLWVLQYRAFHNQQEIRGLYLCSKRYAIAQDDSIQLPGRFCFWVTEPVLFFLLEAVNLIYGKKESIQEIDTLTYLGIFLAVG